MRGADTMVRRLTAIATAMVTNVGTRRKASPQYAGKRDMVQGYPKKDEPLRAGSRTRLQR